MYEMYLELFERYGNQQSEMFIASPKFWPRRVSKSVEQNVQGG